MSAAHGPPAPRTTRSPRRRSTAARSPALRTPAEADTSAPPAAWCRSRSRLQLVRVVGDHFGAGLGDEQDVLEADAAHAGAVEARLERDHVALDEIVAGA